MTRLHCLFSSLLFCAAAAFAQTPTYLVLLKGASALAYYSPEGKLLAKVPVGQHPHEMVLSPDGKFLYTTDNGTMRIEHAGKGGNTISIIDIAARRKVGEINLGEYHRPHGIDIDRSTGHVLVSTENPDQLLVLDPVKRSVIRKFDTKGKISHMVTLGADRKFAYVSNDGSSAVAAINVSNGQTKVIQTGARPQGSVLSKDGKELYVTGRESASITVIDTARNEAAANINTSKGPVRIALTPDGKQLVYAAMYDKRVGFADPATRKQTDYVLLPGEPVSISISRDGKRAIASAETSDVIYIIDIAQKKITGEIRTGKGEAPDPVLEVLLK